MLRSLEALLGYTVLSADNDNIGKVSGFYFDDKAWIVRYLVVEIEDRPSGRKVFIPSATLGHPAWETHTFPVKLTKAQVEAGPDIDTDKPVSRQQEIELHTHYRWPLYWTVHGGFVPRHLDEEPLTAAKKETDAGQGEEGDLHLRSVKEVSGYHIEAKDGRIGHVADFIIDDKTWIINYLIIDTRNWLPGKKVLLPPTWIDKVSWVKSLVLVDLSKESIENSPAFDPSEPVNEEYERKFYDYYGRPRN